MNKRGGVWLNDFGDATLVHLARREFLSTFTISHDAFETCRSDGRPRFRVVPGR